MSPNDTISLNEFWTDDTGTYELSVRIDWPTLRSIAKSLPRGGNSIASGATRVDLVCHVKKEANA